MLDFARDSIENVPDGTTGQLDLVKFPGYWGGWSGKHFNAVAIKFVAQSTTQRLMLQRGDLDGTMGLSWQDFAAVSRQWEQIGPTVRCPG